MRKYVALLITIFLTAGLISPAWAKKENPSVKTFIPKINVPERELTFQENKIIKTFFDPIAPIADALMTVTTGKSALTEQEQKKRKRKLEEQKVARKTRRRPRPARGYSSSRGRGSSPYRRGRSGSSPTRWGRRNMPSGRFGRSPYRSPWQPPRRFPSSRQRPGKPSQGIRKRPSHGSAGTSDSDKKLRYKDDKKTKEKREDDHAQKKQTEAAEKVYVKLMDEIKDLNSRVESELKDKTNPARQEQARSAFYQKFISLGKLEPILKNCEILSDKLDSKDISKEGLKKFEQRYNKPQHQTAIHKFIPHLLRILSMPLSPEAQEAGAAAQQRKAQSTIFDHPIIQSVGASKIKEATEAEDKKIGLSYSNQIKPLLRKDSTNLSNEDIEQLKITQETIARIVSKLPTMIHDTKIELKHLTKLQKDIHTKLSTIPAPGQEQQNNE